MCRVYCLIVSSFIARDASSFRDKRILLISISATFRDSISWIFFPKEIVNVLEHLPFSFLENVQDQAITRVQPICGHNSSPHILDRKIFCLRGIFMFPRRLCVLSLSSVFMFSRERVFLPSFSSPNKERITQYDVIV